MAHATAVLTSVAVILSAPFMGQLRAALRSAFPGRFAEIVAGAVAVVVLVALAAAVIGIRDHRRGRYSAIAAAVGAATLFSLATATGTPEVDAVERVHFIEYGLITFLFYRAWRPSGDLSSFVLPVAAGILVGTLEEWFQWFIPNRVGEARDVLLNLVAIGCGLAFSAGVLVPRSFSWRLRRGSATAIGVGMGLALLVFTLFLNRVHLGHEVADEEIGRFRSRYTRDELMAQARDRAARWRESPPVQLVRLSREDQYMDEGLWHIRRRNDAWTASDYQAAKGENRILETFFAPVLDTPTYATPTASRWPDAQRADAEARAGTARGGYVSRAEPYPLLLWPRGLFLSSALAMIAMVVISGIVVDRRPQASSISRAGVTQGTS